MSDASQYRGLIFELEEAVGDSPDDLDWTEELFGRAAQALKALTETDPSVTARNVYLEQRLEEEMADRNAADEEVVRLQALCGQSHVAPVGGLTEREALAWVIESGWGDPTWDGETLRPIDRKIADAVLNAGYHL